MKDMSTRHRGPVAEVLALDTFVKLARAAESLGARLASSLAEAGLTESQFGALEALLHIGPLHQCDLGKKLLRSSGNITLVVDNLEKRGLVTRTREAADRRFVRVALTADGEHLIRRVFPHHAAQITALLSVLSEEEQRHLGRLCRRVGLQQRG